MAARQHAHRAHFSIDIVEVHADGERAEIGVWPELNILMPLDCLSPVSPFEVQF